MRQRYREAQASGDYLGLSSVVLFELWYGLAKSGQVQENTERLRVLLSGDVDLLDFAGQALRRGLTVVTANISEFSQVAGLSWQDWTT